MIERNPENIPSRHLPASKNWGSEIEEISPDNLLSFFGPDSSLSQNHLIQFAGEPCIDHFVDFVWKGGEACSLSFSIEGGGNVFYSKTKKIPFFALSRNSFGKYSVKGGVGSSLMCNPFLAITLSQKGGGGF